MGYVVKQADLKKERHIMVGILQNNRQVDDFDYNKRFEWIYENNPYGKARAWIIWDDKNDLPVGFTGVFPRPVYVNGQRVMCWNCGDFSIEKKYRTLGIAIKLRKAAKEAVDSGEIPFLYAHPNERMEVIHLKVGHKKIAQMQRFALPIRATRLIHSYVKNNALTWLLSKPANFLLSLKYRFSTFLGISGVIHDEVKVGQDHDQLAERMYESFKVVGERSTTYLNWKFGSNPNRRYSQFDLYYKGMLVGCVFYVQRDDAVYVLDVLVDDFDRFAGELFRNFINSIRKAYNRSIVSVSFILQEFNPFIPVLKKLGFRYRDDATSGVISYANEEINPQTATAVLDGKSWFMTVGDRDA